ncbi:MAG: S41 family peptidase [Bacteroidota bacterium]
MKTLLIILSLGFWVVSYSQSDGLNLPTQNPDSVRSELNEMFAELRKKHPGFYRYNEIEKFDRIIDSTISTIQSPINELEILRKTKPLFAKIGCLHTGIHLSDETENYLNEDPNFLPFTLYFYQGKAIVWKSFDEESAVKTGSIISKINGREIPEIYNQLLQNIAMDGYNETGKYKLLQYTFPQWYRNIIEVAESFEVELENGKKYKVRGVKEEKIFGYNDIVNKPMSLRIIDSIAIIKIPSFANSYLKSHDQKFRRTIESYLETIKEQDIQTILFDLRANSGGSDSNPAWLSSIFLDEPFRYWDRIEITESVAKDISGFKRLFYDNPKFENGEWLWSTKGLFSKEFKFTRVQEPSKISYDGGVYILADGMCLSSCSDFTAIMQTNKRAIVLGEETGGGYQGNTSGLIPSAQLECGLVIDVPLLMYFNSVEKDKNMGRGTIPDFELQPSFEELSKDEEYLERVLEKIKTH